MGNHKRIKAAYWAATLSYESALLALERIGYGPAMADDFLFRQDEVRHAAELADKETSK